MENCKKIEPLLIDFVDKTLNQEETLLVKTHLEGCKNCRDEVDGLVVLFDEMNQVQDELPDQSLRQGFEAMLKSEKQKAGSATIFTLRLGQRLHWIYTTFGQIAAAFALLITGMLLGLLINSNRGDISKADDLKNELNQMKDLLILTKLDQPSASQRIMAANYLEEMTALDKEVLNALINTLNTDKNSNVRMAALNALAKFKDQQLVKDAFVETMSIQTDPIIQISLINILVEMQDKRAVNKMKEMLEKNSTNTSVKKLAEKGILRLI
jgi:cyclophilin family peptidyl-prolyl cis-trans isomerase